MSGNSQVSRLPGCTEEPNTQVIRCARGDDVCSASRWAKPPPPAPVSPSNKLCRRGQTSMRTRGGLEPHAGERQKRQTTSPTREAKMCSRFLHGSVDKKRRPPIPPKRVHPCPEKRGAANNTGNPSGRSGPMTIVPRASARQKANMSESSEVPGRQLIAMSWNFVISQLIGPRRATYVYSPRYVVHVG